MTTLSLNERRKQMMAEYGWTFVTISFCIFIIEMLVLVSLIDFWNISPRVLASKIGLDVSIPDSSGTWVMAYIITRAVKIPQLLLTAALTPFVAKAWRQRRNRSLSEPDEGSES